MARVDAAPNGYLNVFLDRPAFLLARLGLAGTLPPPPARTEKTIVEHTAINPNKAAHIGHLRNSALGDTLVRVLRFRGNPVEVQNYIDDTGVQVADVVVGFQRARAARRSTTRSASPTTTRFDYYCWDLYARVTEWYEGDKERLKIRAATLHDIEHGVEPDGEPRGVHRRHRRPRAPEDDGAAQHRLPAADVGRRHPAPEVLGARVRGAEGDRRRLPADRGPARRLLGDEDRRRAAGDTGDEASDDGGRRRQREKVIVRSNGTVVYVGKDMAYQFWKSGLLGHDFLYRTFATRMDGGDAVGDDERSGAGGRRASDVRRRRRDLQRDRRAAVVPAEAAQAGARRRSAIRRKRIG